VARIGYIAKAIAGYLIARGRTLGASVHKGLEGFGKSIIFVLE
jgi:hypothetical protein